MKRQIYLLPFLILFTGSVWADEREDLLKELDRVVTHRQMYMDIKEHRIDSLRRLLSADAPVEGQLDLYQQISHEYTTYRYDSAWKYMLKGEELVAKAGIKRYRDEAAIHACLLLSTTGMYMESLTHLQQIDPSTLDSALLYDYYSTYEWACYAAGEYTNDNRYTPEYRQMERLYTDSVFSVLTPGTDPYLYYQAKILLQNGKAEGALHTYLDLYPTLRIDTRLYAIVTYDIANIYHRFGNQDLYEKFLILAAISDQVCPLKENLAMQELALYLFRNKPEDLNRAYTYIQCAMEDARFYNNRLRMLQISEKLPVIVKAYQEKSEQEKRNLTLALAAITLLSVITMASLLYVDKQMRQVKKSRRALEILNQELHILNEKLNDSNHTKEEYVGLFIDLCSSYIDKLDKYRETVKRKLIAKQVDDLYKMASSTRAIESELDDFFHSFDSAFLKLYPTFIEDFNKLLLPDEQILPRKGEILNRELRIFALIRLGIDDSSRIASFLRYSPQTIYNNRTKVRNKAVHKESFEKELMKIGNYPV